MTFVFIGILVFATLALTVPTHGFHRRRIPSGRPEFIDLEKYYQLRCLGTQEVSGPYDDFVGVFKYSASIINFATNNHMSLAGFRGIHCAPYIIMDLDGPEAFEHAKTLYCFLVKNLSIPVEAILFFFSGNRGMHFYMDAGAVGAKPSDRFYLYAKLFCRRLAEEAGVVIDMAVYGPLQLVRSPNAKHPSSCLYKIFLLLEELTGMSWGDVRKMAEQPRHIELPPPVDTVSPDLANRWNDCVAAVDNSVNERNAKRIRSAPSSSVPQSPALSGSKGSVHPFLDNFPIYNTTRDFLLNGASEGTRHTRLVAAAKNFADFGPGAKELAYALLFPTAFLSGLPEPEIRNIIEWAFKERR